MSEQTHMVQITADNPKLASLKKSWATAVFSAEDGIGPMGSLHQAGDSLVAVAAMTEEGFKAIGSGVMIGPGLMLTASHVLEEFPQDATGPVCLTFLPGAARAWLPTGRTTATGPSDFHPDRRRVSDLTLMSCGLNSEACEDFPLMLAPVQLAMPLIGDRL
jgi:V8-like Glu-specific endopeptidase